MTEKQAEEKGYNFTGIYDRDRVKVMVRKQEEFINNGYKAVLVTVPTSKYSRSGGGSGYAIYVEERYFINQRIQTLKEALYLMPSRIKEAKEVYENTVQDIEIDRAKINEELSKLIKEQIK